MSDSETPLDIFDLSVAVVHEHYYERGGAEYVAETIAEIFDAPIYTGFINSEALPNRSDLEIHGLFGDRSLSPLVRKYPWFRDFYYQFAWQKVSELTEYDVLIQSGNNPGWYVPPEEQVIVKYVHTTPRTAYDLFHQRANSFSAKLYAYASRVLYAPNIPYPDVYVANSELVARRLQRYWGVDEPVTVYPPTDTSSFSVQEKEDFYLSYSRLTEDKRFDEIIDAFKDHPEKQLVIGGSGPKEKELKNRARDMGNIEFRGYLSEDEKRDLLGRAKALIYAANNEDFGMVPIEAYASGTPVIGVRDGYTKYQIEDRVTGILFDRGVGNLSNAIEKFEESGVNATPMELVEVAEHYSRDKFNSRIRKAVQSAVRAAHIDVSPTSH